MVLASPVVSSCPASQCSVLSFAVDEELSDIDKYHWLNISIKFHNVNLMKDLITSEVCVNFPPNVPADADFSPLHNCIEYNLLEGVYILLDAGANVNIRALKDYKPTPIHQAIVHDNLPMVKMLLAHGADPYCLIHGLRPILNEPFSWDCFEMAKVFENEEVISYFSGYKVGPFVVVRVTFECCVVPYSLNEFLSISELFVIPPLHWPS